MAKTIYLDHDVFVRLRRDERPGLAGHIAAFKQEEFLFTYSPAHLEEIAVIIREVQDQTEAEKRVAESIAILSQTTGNWEFLPAEHNQGPSRLIQEDPRICMSRVLDGYELTLAAEENERSLMSMKSAAAFEEVYGELGADVKAEPGVPLFERRRAEDEINVLAVNNLAPENLFTDSKVLAGLGVKLWNYNYEWNLDTLPKGAELLASHKTRETVVNLVFAYLEQIGYRADSFDKFRSRMHDVSHAIYAAAANVVVTGDGRYLMRLRAAHRFLGLPTLPLSLDEFMAASPDDVNERMKQT
ncbi:hypothetical protein [Paludisphaera mucosa]|uniref:DUF4935 domain-containing protein n=1 Tax=Paludisphaera mucosa TaxID=3030827 RepID=A0ABT6FLI6_9BACT|nr:hypothetical protein [Paludisphaera mucosa]MDG3008394.1 hypothetical protein [Paludisphaera mucosa]